MPETVTLRELAIGDEADARRAQAELAAENLDFLLDPDTDTFGDYLAALAWMREGRDLPPRIVPSHVPRRFRRQQIGRTCLNPPRIE